MITNQKSVLQAMAKDKKEQLTPKRREQSQRWMTSPWSCPAPSTLRKVHVLAIELGWNFTDSSWKTNLIQENNLYFK